MHEQRAVAVDDTPTIVERDHSAAKRLDVHEVGREWRAEVAGRVRSERPAW
jgi:hypothetical protein